MAYRLVRAHYGVDRCAANQRTLASSKNVADLFWEHGIAVNTKVNKDLFSGINTVKVYFYNSSNRPQIYIFSTCVNLIREIMSYWWAVVTLQSKKMTIL